MSALGLIILCALGAVAPLVAAAWWLRAYPRPLLVWLGLIPAALAFGVIFYYPWAAVVIAVDAAILFAVLSDLLLLPHRKALLIERETGRIASLRKPHPVALVVTNQTGRPIRATIRDGVPQALNPKPDEFELTLAPRSRARLNYELRAGRRGAFAIDTVHVNLRSRFGLWNRWLRLPAESTLNVYPDMKQLGQYALLARVNRLNLLGVRRTRRIGQDNEFERLRDYTVDDNYRHIDWRSTARRLKLTVRDYQANQSQRIIFLMDCGRMMTNEAAGLSLLDHGFNAMLMLAYVALRQGDSVGMIAFSDEIHTFIPPRAGMNQMNRLLHASFDRFPQLVESRYDLAFRYLASHCRRRSLVVLVTNVIDEVNAHQVQRYLTNLVGRHLPLGVMLRDRTLFDAVEPEHPDDEQIWLAAAAADILAWRHQVLGDLERQGAMALDVFPEHMTAPLVNRYLELKARHLL